MLSAMIEGSLERSPMTLSAGGQDEQPCEVKSSTTARGSASAGRMTATIAQIPSAPDQSAPDQRETRLEAIIAVMSNVTPSHAWGKSYRLMVTVVLRASHIQPSDARFSAGRNHRKRALTHEGGLVIGRLRLTFYSLRGEPPFTNSRLGRELAQHVVQDAAVPVVFELVQRIDAAKQRNPLQRTVAGDDLRGQLLARLQVADAGRAS